MLSIEIFNAPKPDNSKKIEKMQLPSFVTHQPDLAEIKKLSSKKKVLVVGNGGSIQSFRAFAGMLAPEKDWGIVHTMEPDYLNFLKKKFKTSDTLVVPVSKSGSNVGQLEAMFSFLDYKMLAVTGTDGTLWEIAKALKLQTIEHPDVGGRYAGRTSAALAPAAALGLDIEEINKGALSMYEKCNPNSKDNPAFQAASILAQLRKKGYSELFCPFYSVRLGSFLPLLIQLIHESSAKGGAGLTAYGDVGPESQHHTNQRFFGGPKTVSGLFFNVKNQDDEKSTTKVPKNVQGIKLRESTLNVLDAIPLAKSLEFEYQGTLKDAINKKIPVIAVTIDEVNAYTCGELLGFLQYFTVYYCVLTGVNPFDQPQVESSKDISFNLRAELKK